MSYVRQHRSAADASWAGAFEYTRPPSAAAGATWEPSGQAKGFSAAKVGAPSTPIPVLGFCVAFVGNPSLRMATEGFTSTAFGLAGTLGFYQQAGAGPFALFGVHDTRITHVAKGAAHAVIGSPSMPMPVSGVSATQYGSPIGFQFWSQRSLPPTTVIPGPYSPFPQLSEASGRANTRIGTAFASTSSVQAIHWAAAAGGFSATFVGTPATAMPSGATAGGSRHARVGSPTSLSSMIGVVIRFGIPRAVSAHVASGDCSVFFGAPFARVSVGAKGACRTAIGYPNSILVCGAAGRATTAFGAPSARRNGTYLAWPTAAPARFGRAAALRRLNYPAAGACATQCGTPSCSLAYRAMHIPPETHIGTASMVRPTSC